MPDASPVDKVFHGKTAGMPNSIWIVVLGAALVAGYYLRKKKAANANPIGDQVASDGSGTTLGYEVGQNPISFLNITPPPITPPPDATAQGFQTNNDWAVGALKFLQAQPNYYGTSPTVASTAINDYIAGKPLGLWEQWTINAIQTGKNQFGVGPGTGIGPPPQLPPSGGFSGSGVGDGNSKPAGVVPLNVSPDVYVIQPGDTNLQHIADQYGMSWQTLFNANRQTIKNPAMVGSLAGAQLHIPQ